MGRWMEVWLGGWVGLWMDVSEFGWVDGSMGGLKNE